MPTTVTKDDVTAFCNFCVLLRSVWRHYQILFEGKELKRELLQSIAPTFFGDLNLMLIEHLILQVCKITDPEETQGRQNLTVEFLVENSDFSSAPETAARLRDLSDGMHRFRSKIVVARNKLIGHLDRESVTLRETLGGAPSEDWNHFWLDLQEFLHALHKEYVDPSGNFYLNGISQLSDADDLLKALKESTYFRSLLSDRETTKKAADIAFGSKFYDA